MSSEVDPVSEAESGKWPPRIGHLSAQHSDPKNCQLPRRDSERPGNQCQNRTDRIVGNSPGEPSSARRELFSWLKGKVGAKGTVGRRSMDFLDRNGKKDQQAEREKFFCLLFISNQVPNRR